MLTFLGQQHSLCDGGSRRSFLKLGALTLGGPTLADVLRAQTRGDTKRKPKAVIMVTLQGGLSHCDSYDLKPFAPEGSRSEFKPIQTKIPGVCLCEHMPKQAEILDKLVLLRGVVTSTIEHDLHEIFSGYHKAEKRPAFGSIVSKLQSDSGGLLPKYVSTKAGYRPDLDAAEDPRYLGSVHRPFIPEKSGLANLELSRSVKRERMQNRKELLRELDTIRRDIDSDRLSGMDDFQTKALEIISSPKAREAFNVDLEPDYVKEKYGGEIPYANLNAPKSIWPGRDFLLARRLVEAGVSVVTVNPAAWDHHDGVFKYLRTMLPLLDRSIHALVTDLHERGLENDVAVIVWGEFGRRPKLPPME